MLLKTRTSILRIGSGNGWQLNTIDAFIAALTLRYDLTLLTSDGDFNAVPELKHANWLVS